MELERELQKIVVLDYILVIILLQIFLQENVSPSKEGI